MKKKGAPTFMEIYKNNPLPPEQQAVNQSLAPDNNAQAAMPPVDETRPDISKLVKIILPSSLAVLLLAAAFYLGGAVNTSGTVTIKLASMEFRSIEQRNMALAQYDKIIAALAAEGITKNNDCWIRIDNNSILLYMGRFLSANNSLLEKIRTAKVKVDNREIVFTNAAFVDVR